MRLLAIPLLAALVGCSSGAVKGKVILGETPAKQGIFAAIWQVDAQLSNPNDPHSTLIPKVNGEPATFMGTMAVGTTTGKPGSYDYAFHTVDRGLYFVGAYLADPADPSPDIEGAIHTVDIISLLEVDPELDKKKEISHDIYLAISGPGTGTIRGTVRASTRAANSTISVWAGDGSLVDPSTTLFMRQKLPAGVDVPFALFNVPLGEAHLFADADVGNDGDLNNDFLGFPSPNPIVLNDSHTEQTDVDIWVDRQAPNLGSISGTLALNAPVSSALVQLMVEAESYGSDKLVGFVTVPVSGSSVPFTIPSVPFGDLFVSNVVAVTVNKGEENETTLTGSGYYPGPPSFPGPISVTSAQPMVADVSVPIGVGQVLGKVALKNIPPTYKAVYVLTSFPNPNPTTDIREKRVPFDGMGWALDGTTFAADFALFGYINGSYNVFLVPVPTVDSDPVDAWFGDNLAIDGNPAVVKIEGGNRVSSDITYDFAAH